MFESKSVRGFVLGLVDDTHASTGEFLDEAVMRDDLVNY